MIRNISLALSVARAWARLSFLVLVLCLVASGGCASPQKTVGLPEPIEATTLNAGDVFQMQIVGEEKLPELFTVAPDGTVDLPYVKRIKVAGLEPQDVAELVRKRLMEQQILVDPNVTVSVKEYNSKRVEVIGEVQKPGSLPLQPGMTLLRAISLAGGFNQIADKNRVVLRRRVNGKFIAATVSVADIMSSKSPDIPLQAGDSINVEHRLF